MRSICSNYSETCRRQCQGCESPRALRTRDILMGINNCRGGSRFVDRMRNSLHRHAECEEGDTVTLADPPKKQTLDAVKGSTEYSTIVVAASKSRSSTMEREITPTMERADSEYVDALNGVEPEPPQRLNIPIKFNMDVNLGVNLSIALILLIFSGLLFLPSKMLFDTSYEVQNDSETNRSSAHPLNFLSSAEFRRRKLCPGPDYKYLMVSTFYSNYDANCTYPRARARKMDKKATATAAAVSFREKALCASDKKDTIITYNYNRTIDEVRAARPKSIPVTGHILAMMLIVSAVAAFVEVLRIRFINPKDSSAVETAGSRKGSTVELMIQGRFVPRAPMRSQRSFESQGMHRSPLRLLGARPPPLIRRSSFPTYLAETMDLATTDDTPTGRSTSRRPSVNSEAVDAGFFASALHRRARLIRRH